MISQTAQAPRTGEGLEFDAALDERGFEVALRVKPGQTVAVLGANGSGKSTLLALIAGLLRPSRGQASLNGTPIVGAGTAVPVHRRRTALLTQDVRLFPHLSVLDNVAFAPRSSGVRREQARKQAGQWLTAAGVEALAARRPHELSGGQAQRVAIARALAAEPELMLLDEPMAALDVAATPQIRRLLRSVLAAKTAIVVTHEVLDALMLADYTVILRAGHIVEQGLTQRLFETPTDPFTARLAGLNFIRSELDGAAWATVFPASSVAVYPQASGAEKNSTSNHAAGYSVLIEDLEPQGSLIAVSGVEVTSGVRLTAEVPAAYLAAHSSERMHFIERTHSIEPGARCLFVPEASGTRTYRL